MLPALPLAAAAAPSVAGPILGSAGIGAITSIGGGLLSNLFNRKSQDKSAAENREVLQNAISWRVADAKRAGIHPLYALGANVATSGGQPQFIGDSLGPSLQEAGQNISTAVARSQTGDQQLKNQLDLALMRSQISETDARTMFIRSQQRALEQGGNGSPSGMGLQQEQVIQGQSPNVPGIGVIDLKPSEQISAKQGAPDTAAGRHPWFQENTYGKVPFLTPRGQGEHPEELLSNMSLGAYIGLLRRNQSQYGPKWLDKFMDERYGTPMPGTQTMRDLDGVSASVQRELQKYKHEKQQQFRRYQKKWNERR